MGEAEANHNLDPDPKQDQPQIEEVLTQEPIADEIVVAIPEPPSASSVRWSPLIYGRTYEVDFRFLVVPAGFSEKNQNYIWEFIKVTTRSAETLSHQPRWMFLRNDRRCVIGVTCLVRDLLESQEMHGEEDLTRDRHGRPLYAFVGYVSETPFPETVPAMDLARFADAYREWVPQKWRESYVIDRQGNPKPLRIAYDTVFKPEEGVKFDPDGASISFEQLVPRYDDTIVLINRAESQNILYAVAQSNLSVSVCFGNLSQKDLVNSQFMTAALNQIQTRVEVQIKQANPSIQSQSPQQIETQSRSGPHSREVHTQRRYEPPRNRLNFIPNLIVGASKIARSGIETVSGEKAARDLDDFMFNTLGQIGQVFLGEEAVAQMYADIANLDEFEERLFTAIHLTITERNQLEVEYENLIAQGKKYEAEDVRDRITRQNEKLAYAKKKYDEITRVLGIENPFSSMQNYPARSQQRSMSQGLTDVGFGFKEKSDQQASGLDSDSHQSKDPWAL